MSTHTRVALEPPTDLCAYPPNPPFSSRRTGGHRIIKTVEILNIDIERENSLVIAVASAKNGPTKESVLERLVFQVRDNANAVQWQSNVLSHVYKGKCLPKNIFTAPTWFLWEFFLG